MKQWCRKQIKSGEALASCFHAVLGGSGGMPPQKIVAFLDILRRFLSQFQ